MLPATNCLVLGRSDGGICDVLLEDHDAMDGRAGRLACNWGKSRVVDVGGCGTLQLCPGRTDTLCQRLCKL